MAPNENKKIDTDAPLSGFHGMKTDQDPLYFEKISQKETEMNASRSQNPLAENGKDEIQELPKLDWSFHGPNKDGAIAESETKGASGVKPDLKNIHTLEGDKELARPNTIDELPPLPVFEDEEKKVVHSPGFLGMPTEEELPETVASQTSPENVAEHELQASSETIETNDEDESKSIADLIRAERDTENTTKLATVHTLGDDVSNALKKGASQTSMAIAESQHRNYEPKETSIETKTILTVVSIVLILMGIGILLYLLFGRSKPPLPPLPPPALVKSDFERTADTSSLESFFYRHKNELRRQIPNNQIVEIKLQTKEIKDDVTYERPLATKEFVTLIKADVPPSLLRTFMDDFFLGIHSFNEINYPFLIIKVSNYDTAYAGMLLWEKNMENSLADLFEYKKGVIEIKERVFEDGIIENKDVRFLLDQNSSTKLLYSFTDPTTLVITTNEKTLREVGERFRTSKLVR
ncbi:MAG TPA: hypothetical protein VI981_04175 [Candidatus Paceibacterota bacterium]